jgi:hypothetical protein
MARLLWQDPDKISQRYSDDVLALPAMARLLWQEPYEFFQQYGDNALDTSLRSVTQFSLSMSLCGFCGRIHRQPQSPLVRLVRGDGLTCHHDLSLAS